MAYQGCECWWAEPTQNAFRLLRVVEGAEDSCPASPWRHHHASVRLPDVYPIERGEHGGWLGYFEEPAPDDPAWPTACQHCGAAFTGAPGDDGTRRYTDVDRIYARAVTGDAVVLRGPGGEGGLGPVGMLTHAEDWAPGGEWEDRYGDGINLLAVCPNGTIWHVDGYAWGDGKKGTKDAWSRTGDPRVPGTLVVTPSIVAADYHGWLGQNAPPGWFSVG